MHTMRVCVSMYKDTYTYDWTHVSLAKVELRDWNTTRAISQQVRRALWVPALHGIMFQRGGRALAVLRNLRSPQGQHRGEAKRRGGGYWPQRVAGSESHIIAVRALTVSVRAGGVVWALSSRVSCTQSGSPCKDYSAVYQRKREDRNAYSIIRNNLSSCL